MPPPPGLPTALTLPTTARPRPHDPGDVNAPRYDYGWVVSPFDLITYTLPWPASASHSHLEEYLRSNWVKSPSDSRAREAYGLVAG